MEDSIRNFKQQFSFEPHVEHGEKLGTYDHYVFCGMGGSHLQAGIMKMYQPGIDLFVHRSYDLPPYDDEFLRKSLIILSSYSGNTEEVLSALETVRIKGYQCAIITAGGTLLEKAREHKIPHVVLPQDGIQPRMALGHSLLALAKLLGDEHCIADVRDLKFTLHPEGLESQGRELAEQLAGKIPVICTSNQNLHIAYSWKIKMNETAKVPAFYNIFPELNHNEMQGYGETDHADDLHFIFLNDPTDHDMIQERMRITESLYEAKGYPVTTLTLLGEDVLHKIFSSLLLADWTALALAEMREVEPEAVPLIEDFKKKLHK